jgi:hypothetical protein
MKKWVLKACFQKAISFFPFKHRINFLFQKYITKGVNLSDEYFEDRLLHASNHLKGYRELSNLQIPEKTLELGTGWYPVVPFMFFLCGSREIHSIDIARLSNKERLVTTINKLAAALNDREKKHLFKTFDIIPERLSIFNELAINAPSRSETEILKELRLHFSVTDARATNFQDDYFDLVHSNNTFEHVYPEILKNILHEFARVTKKKSGVMSHFIDMSDHFAHFDKSITIYNFLRFSEDQWKWIDNSIQPMNRLRLPDYIQMYKELNIPVSLLENRPGRIRELESVKIDKTFSKYTKEENAISHSYVFSAV